jgi:hypothetical protein
MKSYKLFKHPSGDVTTIKKDWNWTGLPLRIDIGAVPWRVATCIFSMTTIWVMAPASGRLGSASLSGTRYCNRRAVLEKLVAAHWADIPFDSADVHWKLPRPMSDMASTVSRGNREHGEERLMSDPVPRDLLAIEVAIAMAVIGVASERRGLQRRARRSYFGKGRVLSCGSMDFEASEAKRKAKRDWRVLERAAAFSRRFWHLGLVRCLVSAPVAPAPKKTGRWNR